MLSKCLEFLSSQVVHHIEAGIILYLVLSLASNPASSQLFRAWVILLVIVHEMPLRLDGKNMEKNFDKQLCL